MKLALCQMNISFEDKRASFETAKSFIKKAAEASADMIAFPEMTLTGFSMNTAKTKENGETKRLFAELAEKHSIAAAFGWVLDCGERARNMYTVVDKNGTELAEYAKIHPFSYAGEDGLFEGGSRQSFFEFMGIRAGLAVCYDLRFPRLFEGEYDLMIIPANWPERRSEHWKTLLKARAIENQAYFAGINCIGLMDGQYYSGGTALLDPDGRELDCLYGTEGLITADISTAEVKEKRAAFPVRNDRRYDIYDKL